MVGPRYFHPQTVGGVEGSIIRYGLVAFEHCRIPDQAEKCDADKGLAGDGEVLHRRMRRAAHGQLLQRRCETARTPLLAIRYQLHYCGGPATSTRPTCCRPQAPPPNVSDPKPRPCKASSNRDQATTVHQPPPAAASDAASAAVCLRDPLGGTSAAIFSQEPRFAVATAADNQLTDGSALGTRPGRELPSASTAPPSNLDAPIPFAVASLRSLRASSTALTRTHRPRQTRVQCPTLPVFSRLRSPFLRARPCSAADAPRSSH